MNKSQKFFLYALLLLIICNGCSKSYTLGDLYKKTDNINYQVLLPELIPEGFLLKSIEKEEETLVLLFVEKKNDARYIEYIQSPQNTIMYNKLKQISIGDIEKKQVKNLVEIHDLVGLIEETEGSHSLMFVPKDYMESLDFFPLYQVTTNISKEVLFDFISILKID